MIKVKTFAIRRRWADIDLEGLDNKINNFIAENNIEVVDIKFSTSMADTDERRYSWIPCAMLIYKEQG